jgi:hypothetical protein
MPAFNSLAGEDGHNLMSVSGVAGGNNCKSGDYICESYFRAGKLPRLVVLVGSVTPHTWGWSQLRKFTSDDAFPLL